jgi:TPR repeat protein
MDQNTEQAAQLMQKAKPGLQKLTSDPYAMTALATIYERENPTSPKVRDLLTKAAEMGYEPAQTKLSQTNQ